MRTTLLDPAEVLAGYAAVRRLYPNIPSMILLRGWEFAAYRHFSLVEPVLDIGCGDGRYFQFIWPQIRDVWGLEVDPGAAEAARRSGVYRAVYVSAAHELDAPAGSFRSAFANCSLEHMDRLAEVLAAVYRSLQPGGEFLLSVHTDKWIEWASLPLLLEKTGEPVRAKSLLAGYVNYHHCVSLLAPSGWIQNLRDAGFEVLEHIPTLPEMTGRFFLFLDHLWHLPSPAGEVGDRLFAVFSATPRFADGLQKVLEGILRMEPDWRTGCGAVFHARKPGGREPHVILSSEGRGQATMSGAARCWCGNTDLERFSPEYLKCSACETLVVVHMPEPAALRVSEDEQGFYGRRYYESYLVEQYGFPTLAERARLDLPERCLHWLGGALRYKLPPGRALELGSAHGGFVALLRWAGFDATGLELSPRVVEFASQSFGVPMLRGPVEEQALESGSLDLVAAMDVIEHLGDPLATLKHCASLLKPDGIVFIQTPCYPEGRSYEQMVAENDPFLSHLKPEHLFLFSKTSIRKLFGLIGVPHIEFLPAIFAHYDLSVAASKMPLECHEPAEIREHLLANPTGRMVDALLTKDDELKTAFQEVSRCKDTCVACEADRAARLEIIERQGRELGVVTAERNNLRAELEHVQRHFATAEEDRTARLEVIERQGRELGVLTAERNKLRAELEELRGHFEASEADRAARLEVIERQGRELGVLAAEHNQAQAELKDLRGQSEALNADRVQIMSTIQTEERELAGLRTAVADRERQIGELSASLNTRQLVLDRIRNGYAYRLLRTLGGWKWVEESLEQGLPLSPSAPATPQK